MSFILALSRDALESAAKLPVVALVGVVNTPPLRFYWPTSCLNPVECCELLTLLVLDRLYLAVV